MFKKISQEVKETIEKSSVTLFRNMNPVVTTKQSDISKFNNYVLFTTFSVEVKCELEFPIKFLGKSTPNILVINSRAEVGVNDAAEFIRNTDMVIDYFEDSKLGQSIKGIFEKINGFIGTFAGS